MAETFIIGNREFTCQPMNPFAANRILMRLQKVVLPVLGALAGKGGATAANLADMDVKEAAGLIAEHLTEELFDTVVFPMFAEARVYSVEDKRFVAKPADVDTVFTTETLFDLYELIFAVGKFQFSPFFASVAARFGLQIAATKAAPN